MESRRLQSKIISTHAANSRDQSPERTKRKSKWATERQAPGDVDSVHERLTESEDGKRRRRLQDPLPLEDVMVVANDCNTSQFVKAIGPDFSSNHLISERVINPEYVPRSGYFFEHDDRSSRRPRQNFKWRSSDWRHGTENCPREDRWQGGILDSSKKPENCWKHDKFSELQAEELADANKKIVGELAMNEQIAPDGENNGQFAASRKMDTMGGAAASDRGRDVNRRIDGRDNGGYPDTGIEIPAEKARVVQSSSQPGSRKVLEHGHWDEDRGLRWIEKDHEQERISYRGARSQRFGGRIREGWGGRSGRESGVHFHDRWKHDLFEEANRSPTPKQEEDPVAKVEALLAA